MSFCYDESMKNEISFQFSPSPSELPVEELVRVLGAAGHSNTRARRAVLQALVSAVEPVSPAELLAAGRLHHPALGLVTVYRTLDILAGLGLVRKLHTSEGCHSYALSTSSLQAAEHDRHAHHIICQDCRRGGVCRLRYRGHRFIRESPDRVCGSAVTGWKCSGCALVVRRSTRESSRSLSPWPSCWPCPWVHASRPRPKLQASPPPQR